MRLLLSAAMLSAGLAAEATADSRTSKYRSGGCEIEEKYDDDGKFEKKVDCKPGHRGAAFRDGRGRVGKEEYRQGRCDIKREWKENGEYKEEVKCR